MMLMCNQYKSEWTDGNIGIVFSSNINIGIVFSSNIKATYSIAVKHGYSKHTL